MENRDSLSGEERIQFDSLCFLNFNSLTRRFQHRFDICEDWKFVMEQNWNQQYWEAYAEVFPEDSRLEIDQLLRQRGSAEQQDNAAGSA